MPGLIRLIYLAVHSLMVNNDKFQQHEIASIPNNMEKSFVKVINEYTNEVRKTPISKDLLDLFKNKQDSGTSIYQVGTDTWTGIPIGTLYNKAIDYHFDATKHEKHMKMGAIMSKLLIVFLMPCNIFLYPPAAIM